MHIENGLITKEALINFERNIEQRFNKGDIPYLIHLSGGNEFQLINSFQNITPGDYIFSTHRSHYHYLLAGGDPNWLEEEIVNGRSMFIFDRGLNFYSSSIVCATPSVAVGVAWALKKKGSNKKVWCFIGDGAVDEGHLYEAARYVDGFGLPCTFIIEDNDRSVSAGKQKRWRYTQRKRPEFICVREYSYTPTYPHGGTGTSGWLKFNKGANIQEQSKYDHSKPIPLHEDLPVIPKYIDAVKQSMNALSLDSRVIFIGYNVQYGSAYGTLKEVPEEQRLETPLAENLMAGLAMGMSLEGFRPVLFFERHDFIYNALDGLVNQLDKIELLSNGQYKMPVIIKAVSGSIKPFYAGMTHTSNLTDLFKHLFHFPVYAPQTPEEVLSAYIEAGQAEGPILISEDKELY